MNFSEDLKKIVLAGIGAVAVTAEKSQEVIETLVNKGEMTVEQGKVLNEELKRRRKDAPQKAESMADSKTGAPQADLLAQVEQMTPEQRAALKAMLEEMDAGK